MQLIKRFSISVLLQVAITDDDLWPTSKPATDFQALKNWFDRHGKMIRKLRIDLNRWENEFCCLETLETMLVDVLRAVHGTLTHLDLRIQGAPLATAHAWLQLLSSTVTSSQAQMWPHLDVLKLEIDGQGAASQAHASYLARQVLSTLPALKSLRKVDVSLNCVKLCVLPPALGICDQIEEFSLNFAANGGPVGLVLPAKRPSSLPFPRNISELSLINPPFATEDLINAVVQIGVYHNLEAFTITSTDQHY